MNNSSNNPNQGLKKPLRAAEIVFEEVTKQFTNETALAVDHISMHVDPGSLIVILGPSGCGKTTLLKMVNRLYEPTSGNIKIDGVEIHNLPVTDLRRRIGYVIQQVGLFPHMTIEQNIAVVPRLENWDSNEINIRVETLLDMVGLPQIYRKKFPRQLSGGEQQRVGLARAMAADPGIMLMDEPFAAVDAINRTCLQEELMNIHQKVNKTVLFVTHDVEEALRLADKILIIRAGKQEQFGTPLEIINHPQNEFVQELIGSGNLLRRLSLLNIHSILNDHKNSSFGNPQLSSNHKEAAIIHPEDDLRSALAKLLETGAAELKVLDREGNQIGVVSFADLRSSLIKETPISQGEE